MSAPYEAEMICYCEHCNCHNHINFTHHHDWSAPEDFACPACVAACYEGE